MKIKILLLISIFAFSTTMVSAFSDNQFQIDLLVSGSADNTAPSVPTSLVATPISTTQINLSWTASTDNVGVTSYRIYREGSFVGTTATTNFSDIGLTSNTTYHYKVSALDAALNESVQSNESEAKTLKGSSGGGGSPVNPIYNVLVTPTENSVNITWRTNTPAINTIYWGQTSDYEAEVIREKTFTSVHEINLSDLSAGTVYYFKIISDNGRGLVVSLDNQSFRTLGIEEGIANPDRFRALPKPKSIDLSWINPTNPNFEEVRIVRSKGFYPADQFDGEMVYEGNGEVFEDTNVKVGEKYYYTIFSKDKNGNYSSGVIASAVVGGSVDQSTPAPDFFDTLEKAPTVDPRIAALNFWDFDFIQDGKKINTEETANVLVDGLKNLTIKLPYEKIPEVLKSIVVTMKDPEDSSKVFSFLLRVNKEKTEYTATIAPLGKKGLYATRIAIVDYKNRGLKATDGNMSVQIALANSAAGKGFNRSMWIIIGLISLIYVTRKGEKYLKTKKIKAAQSI